MSDCHTNTNSDTQKLLLLQTEYYLKQELNALCKIMRGTTFYGESAGDAAMTLLENTLNPLREQLGFVKLELCENGMILASSSNNKLNSESDSE